MKAYCKAASVVIPLVLDFQIINKWEVRFRFNLVPDIQNFSRRYCLTACPASKNGRPSSFPKPLTKILPSSRLSETDLRNQNLSLRTLYNHESLKCAGSFEREPIHALDQVFFTHWIAKVRLRLPRYRYNRLLLPLSQMLSHHCKLATIFDE